MSSLGVSTSTMPVSAAHIAIMPANTVAPEVTEKNFLYKKWKDQSACERTAFVLGVIFLGPFIALYHIGDQSLKLLKFVAVKICKALTAVYKTAVKVVDCLIAGLVQAIFWIYKKAAAAIDVIVNVIAYIANTIWKGLCFVYNKILEPLGSFIIRKAHNLYGAVTNVINRVAIKFEKFLNALNERFADFNRTIGEFEKNMGRQFRKILNAINVRLLQPIARKMTTLASCIKSCATALFITLPCYIYDKGIRPLCRYLWNKITASAKAVSEVVYNIASAVYQAFLRTIDWITRNLVAPFEAAMKKIMSGLSHLAHTLVEKISSIVRAVIQKAQAIIVAFRPFAKAMEKKINQAFVFLDTQIIKPLHRAINAIARAFFIEFPKVIARKCKLLFNNTVVRIYKNILTPLAKQIKVFVIEVFNSFKNCLTVAKNAAVAGAHWSYRKILKPLGKLLLKGVVLTAKCMLFVAKCIWWVVKGLLFDTPRWIYQEAIKPFYKKQIRPFIDLLKLAARDSYINIKEVCTAISNYTRPLFASIANGAKKVANGIVGGIKGVSRGVKGLASNISHYCQDLFRSLRAHPPARA